MARRQREVLPSSLDRRGVVRLKEGKDGPIRNHHHWIFSGAVQKYPKNMKDGDIYPVLSSKGQHLGFGYFNKQSNIVGRMLNFNKKPPLEAVQANVRQAIRMRKAMFDESKTNTYRLINGEGDRVPGLIVDKYADRLIMQISTLGMEKIKSAAFQVLIDELDPKSIYEKSKMPARKYENLHDFEGLLYGEHFKEVEVMENGVKFLVDIRESQKTGLFIDQREMRKYVGEISAEKKVLNCFGYTGGFSLYAALNGASHVTTIDISEGAIENAKANFEANKLDTKTNNDFISADVFDYLEKADKLDYDIVILDPPAFAKKKKDKRAAFSGYRKLNRLALKKAKQNSILITCSCSFHIDEDTFKRAVFEAAIKARRNVKIIETHRQAIDHPMNIYHQEMDYLKSLVLWVE